MLPLFDGYNDSDWGTIVIAVGIHPLARSRLPTIHYTLRPSISPCVMVYAMAMMMCWSPFLAVRHVLYILSSVIQHVLHTFVVMCYSIAMHNVLHTFSMVMCYTLCLWSCVIQCLLPCVMC